MIAPFIEPDLSAIPDALRSLPRWVTWRAEGAPGEKPRKVPYSPAALNSRASSTDPDTWGTFAQAEAAYLEGDRTGIGIVLDGDGLAGVDIDHCVIDGQPDPAALALLASLGAAYVELSPSGTGLRAFGYADQLARGCKGKLNGLDVELYTAGRYLTLTGKTIKAGPIAPLRGFAELADRIRADRKVNPDTGEIEQAAPDERHAQLVQRILSGDVYHDSLRDLAASLVATGMQPGAVVNHLRGLMDSSAAPRDDRWAARRRQIPDLVTSAAGKFEPQMDFNAMLGGEPKPHPLVRFVDLASDPKPPRWVIPGFIGHGVTVISGAHGVGKTTAVLPLALVAAGLHAAGDELAPRHWRHVVYITEDVEQAQRILAGLVGYSNLSLDPAAVRDRVHIVEAMRLDPAYVAQAGAPYREQFTREVEGVEVLPLVVLDTKAAVLALESENDNSEASRMMAALKQGFAGLPVWLIGHVAKANMGRADVAALTSRGAGAIEADANQTAFLVREGDARYLVLGKTRFEPRWPELEITSHLAHTSAADEFGNPELVALRWGIASPPSQSRKEASEQAAEQASKEDAAALRQEVRDLVQTAWQTGFPLNREAVKAKVKRSRTAVIDTIESLLSEQWLIEVAIPARERQHPRKSAFLVNLDTTEHEAVMRGEGLPADKLVIPESWKKQPISSVPELEPETAQEASPDGHE